MLQSQSFLFTFPLHSFKSITMTDIITQKLQQLRGQAKVSLADLGLEQQHLPELITFLRQSPGLQSFELKSTNISPRGFSQIFQCLKECSSLKHLNIEYNSIGISQEGPEELASLCRYLEKLEYLNISSNKINDQTFRPLIDSLALHPSLLFIQLKWNSLTRGSVQELIRAMRDNNRLLYCQLAGNSSSIDTQLVSKFEQRLKLNRNVNQISRERIKNVTWIQPQKVLQQVQPSIPTLSGDRGGGTLKNLQLILQQQKRNKAEVKARLQRQLQELQMQQKSAARTLNEIDQKCNNLVIQNRTLKFELERLVSQNKSLQATQQQQYLMHHNQITEANYQMQDIEKRYTLTLQKMRHQHQIRMKQVGREWDTRIRGIQEQIRATQFQSKSIEEDIARGIEEIATLKLKLQDQQRELVQSIEEEETVRYNARLAVLEGKLSEIQQARELLLKRNDDLIYELESHQKNHREQVTSLELQLEDLKSKNDFYMKKSKQFAQSLDKLNSQLSLKESTLAKYQQDINALNDQIELKKKFNREQVEKVIAEQTHEKDQWHSDKQAQLDKIADLEKTLRALQNENSRLRMQYLNLAEVLQINVNKAITDVFVENNFI